jgi:hypothetical protein
MFGFIERADRWFRQMASINGTGCGAGKKVPAQVQAGFARAGYGMKNSALSAEWFRREGSGGYFDVR